MNSPASNSNALNDTQNAPVGVLSSLGQALYSRLNIAEVAFTGLVAAIKKGAPKQFNERTDQVVNFTKFNDTGTVAMSSSIRVKRDELSNSRCSNFFKLQFGSKVNGSYAKAKDLKGVEFSFDMTVRLFSYLQGSSAKLVINSKGYQASNPVDLEFSRHCDGIYLRIVNGPKTLKFLLDHGDIMDMKVTLLSTLKVRYYYLDAPAIMQLMSVPAVEHSNPAYEAIKDEVESILFGIENVHDESRFKAWIRNKSPGLEMQQSTRKAIWAIANQKLLEVDKDMDSVKLIQQNGSDEFGQKLIDKVNTGSLSEFSRIVSWRKYVPSG